MVGTPNNQAATPNATGSAPETPLPLGPSERSLQLAMAAAQVALDNRGQDVTILDLREQTPVFDYFVLATGTSRRQLHAISEEIDHRLEDDMGDRRMGIEGYAESNWILLDYGSIVVHLFDEQMRGYYDLENLWGNAKRVELKGNTDGEE